MNDRMTNTNGSRILAGLLVGFTGLFLIAGGLFILRRTLYFSETDGFNALWPSLAIFAPALIATIVAFRRSDSSRPLSIVAMLSGAVVAIGLVAAMNESILTREEKLNIALVEYDSFFDETAIKVIGLREAYEQVGAADATTTSEHGLIETLGESRMDFRKPSWDSSESWNAMVVVDSHLYLLSRDGVAKLDYDGFREHALPSYSFDDDIETIAELAYGDKPTGASWSKERTSSFYDDYAVTNWVAHFSQLKHVWIIRPGKRLASQIEGDKYIPGYQPAEAFCFDFNTKELLWSFPFAATNSGETIGYEYRRDDGEMKELARGGAVSRNLTKNVQWAFFQKLKTLAPNTETSYHADKPPYSKESLARSRLAWQKEFGRSAVKAEVAASAFSGGDTSGELSQFRQPAIDLSELTEEQRDELRDLVRLSRIAAVKRLRKLSTASLKECVEFVDGLLEESELAPSN